MISINVTFFIQMANVLILVFLMNLLLYRPIRRIVAQRNQFVGEQQAAIDLAEAEVAAAIEKLNTSIGEARKMGRERIQQIKSSAYEQEKALMQGASENAAKQVQVTRAEIESDIKKARKQLKGQVKAFSVELAQKILGRNI
jgi:F-type H+-transporting ATPase subunit b